MAVPKGTSIGLDLSNPVRVAAYSEETGQVVAAFTAKTPFEPGSKDRLRELAGEIRSFCRGLGIKPGGIAGLPMSEGLLFTVAMPKVNKREFQRALQFEIERLEPGGPDKMRALTREWPKELPVPPSVKVPEGTTLYLVVAANVESTLAARSLMKMAGVRPLGVEISAGPTCRASWWLWEKAGPEDDGGVAAGSSADAAQDQEPGRGAGDSSQETDSYMPWVTHGNGRLSGPLPDGGGGPQGGTPDLKQEDALEDAPSVVLDISIVAKASEALMYLSYGACPWLTREIPLDPDNPFVNGQILAGEITRSARFARASAKGRIDGRVTVFGESDRVSFLADFLKEQTGLGTRLWGQPVLDSDPEYGVAVGLALLQEEGQRP